MAGARVVTHPKTVLVTVPWKGPPSTSAMRGAMTVPSSNNLAQTRNDPDFAPIVRTQSVSSISPLTWPSVVKSQAGSADRIANIGTDRVAAMFVGELAFQDIELFSTVVNVL